MLEFQWGMVYYTSLFILRLCCTVSVVFCALFFAYKLLNWMICFA